MDHLVHSMKFALSLKKKPQVCVREKEGVLRPRVVALEERSLAGIREEIRSVIKEELGKAHDKTFAEYGVAAEKSDSHSRYLIDIRIVMILLAISCVLSSFGTAWLTSRWLMVPRVVSPIFDADGDGVPDANDFCPGSRRSFISGKATDHDHDGCEDNFEDDDRDGDGVLDAFDKCLTSLRPDFESNINNDIDGDGCEDGREDNDDDDDGIDNQHDACPRTGKGLIADSSGCSFQQREELLFKRRQKIAWRLWLISIEALFGALFAALISHFGLNTENIPSFLRRTWSKVSFLLPFQPSVKQKPPPKKRPDKIEAESSELRKCTTPSQPALIKTPPPKRHSSARRAYSA